MNPLEFTLWMGGASDLVGDEPPTKEQWAQIRAKLNITIGKVVADKLLDKANSLGNINNAIDKLKQFRSGPMFPPSHFLNPDALTPHNKGF